MSSVFPSRSVSDAPTPSAASQVPFLKSVSKSMKHKPEIIRKITRTASAKNSLDLNRPSHEQIHHFDSNPSLDGRDGIHKLNRSGSSLSGFGGSGGLDLGSRQRGLAGIGRGASYHARSTSGTSGISAWSGRGDSAGSTPIGGSFRHPWQQTPTVQRGSFTGSMGGGGSYNEPNGFGRPSGSDEDLREQERDCQGRRSLQLGGGYGLNLDGVDEGYERSERPAFERPVVVRSNTSATVRSGSGFGYPTRASYREGESRTYTPISQLPPPLAGSRGRGLGSLRVNTSPSGISVAGVAGRGAANVNGAGGNVTPVSSSSRVNVGSWNGASGSNPDVNSAGLPLNNNSNSALHNSINNSNYTNDSTLYTTVATSNSNLHLSSGLNNSAGHLQSSGSGILTSQPDTSTTSPIYTRSTPSPSTFKTRPSFDMHVPSRLRGKSEPKDIDEARRIWTEKEEAEKAQEIAEQAKKDEKERVKEEKRLKKLEKRGRTSTTSIGSFGIINRGRSDTGATAGTAATYSTAMGSVVSGVPSHRRGGSGATARQNSGIGPGAASYRQHSYNNSYDLDDPANTHAPAFLDTGEYIPTEAEMAAAGAAQRSDRQAEREGSPKVKEVKEKIYAAKSKSHSAWASFMLWFKTRILKMGRSSKKIIKGGKKKAQ